MTATHLNLGRRERQLVEAVYRLRRATVNEVLAELPDPPSYSAVRAMLGKLEKKGYLKHVEEGPRFLYMPAVPAAKASRTALQNLVDTFFQGSAEQAAVALLQLSDTTVSGETLKRLTEHMRQATQEGR